MKKKDLIIKSLSLSVILIVLMAITAACGGYESIAAFQSGAQTTYGAGTGYTYIGNYSSESACKSACIASGYKSDYLWGYSTLHCQCR